MHSNKDQSIRTGMDCGSCVSLFHPTPFLSVSAAVRGLQLQPLTFSQPSQPLRLVDSLQCDCTHPLKSPPSVPLLLASLPLLQTEASRLPNQRLLHLVPHVNPPLEREELFETWVHQHGTLWPCGSETQRFYRTGQRLRQQEGQSPTQRDDCESALIQLQVYWHWMCLGNQKWITRMMEELREAQFEIVQRNTME